MTDERPGFSSAIRTKVYSDLIKKVARGADMAELAPLAARAVMEELGSSGASVTERTGDDQVKYVGCTGIAAGLLGKTNTVTDSFTGRVIREGRARIFDPSQASDSSRERAASGNVSGGMVAPIVVDGQVVGTVGVTANPDDEPYELEELKRLEDFASVLARSVLAARRRS